MDKDKDRFEQCKSRLVNAGFANIVRWSAVNGKDSELVSNEWAKHGTHIKFDESDVRFMDTVSSGFKQGTLLSHMSLWKHFMTKEIAYGIVIEDDVIFHKDWDTLAPEYYTNTPNDYDMVYMGHHCGCGKPYQILRVPVFCTQAMIVSLNGATTLYNRFLNEPNGVRTIDCLINTFMTQALVQNKPFCNWYVWNAEMYPDETASKHPQHAHKDMGLVFQEYIQERTHH
jgi:GR25 family glycosyltransferase involved in LPS biosynthesis